MFLESLVKMENKNPYNSIFDFITSQESSFKTPITLPGQWSWNMQQHIELSYLYNNSQLSTGKDDFKPVKNITRPILNLQHRAEDIDLKDVQIYVDDPDSHHLSLLVKKYHDEVFVEENDLDTFFDELNVSRIDYGGGLSKSVTKGRDVVPLHSIAFCDQRDLVSGVIGLKHIFSPGELQDMAQYGWGDASHGATSTLEETILLARNSYQLAQTTSPNTTPGKDIEVYEVHGDLPRRFKYPEDQSEIFVRQMFVGCFYTKLDCGKQWITLFHEEEKENPFKLIKRDPVYGRALGFGGAEELFEAQVWTNYDMIRMQDMLDAAAKTIMITQDKTLASRHPSGLKDMDNMEFVYEEVNGNTRQLDTFPRNLRLFENSINNWYEHAKDIGASQDPLQGKEPTAGTPFSSLQAQIVQGMGLHEYRRGQFAKHIEEIYRDDYLPKIAKAITKDNKFLAELSMDELQFVSENVVNNAVNEYLKNLMLNGEWEKVTPEAQQVLTEQLKQEFMKKGNKWFMETLKGEFKNKALKVKVNVAGKSKNLPQMVDKLTNIWRFIISNPAGFAQLMQVPALAQDFNAIREFSGLSPSNFAGIEKLLPPPVPQQGVQSPMQPQLTTNA